MTEPRVILQALPSGEILDYAVPLSGASVSRVLTGAGGIDGALPEGYPHPVLEWGSALWVESDGEFYGGGIVTTVEHEDRVLRVACADVTEYPHGQPWTAPNEDLVDVDPLDIFRKVWGHLQGVPGGDLRVDVDDTTSPVRVGEPEREVEFTTSDGEAVAFDTGPFRLGVVDSQDLGDTLAKLAADTPFDYEVRPYWDGDTIRHRLALGYPTLGTRRPDFVLDTRVNCAVLPSLGFDGEGYASEVLLIGAGEGREAVTAHVPTAPTRLRRVAVVADKSIRSRKTAARAAREALAARSTDGTVSNLVMVDTPAAPIALLNPGDTIRVTGPLPTGVFLDHTVRIVEMARTLDDFSKATLTVATE